jgi:hypothetical protein
MVLGASGRDSVPFLREFPSPFLFARQFQISVFKNGNQINQIKMDYRLDDADEMIPFVTGVLDGRHCFDPGLLDSVDSQLPAAQVFQETFDAETGFPHVQVSVGNLEKCLPALM